MSPKNVITKKQKKVRVWKEVIHRYEEMRYLWDKNDPNFKNKNMVREAYETLCEIARKFDKDATPQEVKKKILYMRNNFEIKYRQVQESLTNNSVLPVVPSLWYYDFFTFYGEALGECVREEENFSESEDLSVMSGSDQTPNIEFVRLVQQYPALYNYNLAEYTKREPTEAAWNSIANILNEQPSACRSKWQNLRKMFVHRTRLGRASRRCNPLQEAMAFLLPFIRKQSDAQDSNRNETDNEGLAYEHPDCNDFEDEGCFIKAEAILDLTSQSYTELTNSPTKAAEKERNSDSAAFPFTCIPASNSTLNPISSPVSGSNSVSACVSIPISGSATLPASDSGAGLKNASAAEYPEPKRAKHCVDNESRKYFLLSILPEVQNLSDNQMKFFRHKLLDVLDEAESYSLFNGTGSTC